MADLLGFQFGNYEYHRMFKIGFKNQNTGFFPIKKWLLGNFEF